MSREVNVGRLIDEGKLNRVSLTVIVLCGLIMLMDGFDYMIISVSAPEIMKEWNVGTEPFGVVFSAAFVGYLFGALACGALSDAIGRKKTLIIGACIFSVGTLLVYFAHSVEVLIPMRVFAGIGIGGAVPCAITLTSEYSPLKGRGKYVSVMYSGFLIGTVLAGYAAALMLDSVGWRPLFLVGFFGPAIAIMILAFKLPESARWLASKSNDARHRETLVGIVQRLQPGIQTGPETQFVSADAKSEKRSFGELFAGRLLWVTPVIWALYLISSIAVFFFGSWSPQLLVVKGFTSSTAAFISGSNSILVAAGCLLSGFFFDKAGFRWGAVLYVIAGVCVIFMGDMGPAGFVFLLFASAFFINSAHMDVTILAPIVYPSSCRNRGAGTAVAIARLGAIAGPSLGGYLLGTELSLGTLLALIAIPLSISAVLCFIAGREYDFHFAPLYAGKLPNRDQTLSVKE